MNNLKYKKYWLGLGIFGIVSLLVLCLLPMSNLPKVSVNDKYVHFLAYFVVGSWFSGVFVRKNYLTLGIFLLFFSYLIEVLQGLSRYRSFEWQDLLANGLGIFVSLVLGILFLHSWCQKFEKKFLKVT